MPQAIPIAASIGVSAAGIHGMGAVLIVTASAMVAGTIQRGMTESALDKYKKGISRDSDNSSNGVGVGTSSTQENLKLIYGTNRVGANTIYLSTAGWTPVNPAQLLCVVLALGEGECSQINHIYVNNKDLDLNSLSTGITNDQSVWDVTKPPALLGGNLVLDGNFIEFTPGYPDVFTRWTMSNSQTFASINNRIDMTSPTYGVCMNVSPTAPNGSAYQTITVVDGAWHYLTFFHTIMNYAGLPQTGTPQFGVYDVTHGAWITTGTWVSFSRLKVWTQYGYVFKVPAGCVSIRIHLGSAANGGGCFYSGVNLQQMPGDSVGTYDPTFFGTAVQQFFHSGSAAQVVDPFLYNYVPPAVGTWADELHNTCYLVMSFQYNETLFTSYPDIQVEMDGLLLYDYRTPLAPKAFSNNPALCLYDYMTNTRYGLGIATTAFDLPSWEAAATFCDDKNFGLDCVIDLSMSAIDIINYICLHFRGQLVWYDGMFYLRYAQWEAIPVMDLNDAHIVSIGIEEVSGLDRPSGLRVSYIEKDKNSIVDSLIVGAEDGVIRELDLTGCSTRKMVGDLGTYYLEKARLGRTIHGIFRDDALQLDPFDVVSLTSSVLGIADQDMRVQTANILGNGNIELTLTYEEATLYNDTYEVGVDTAYNCVLPDPTASMSSYGVNPVIIAEEHYESNGTINTRLLVTFTLPIDYPYYDHVEVYQGLDGGSWKYNFPAKYSFEIPFVEEKQEYHFRFKIVNIWGVKQSDADDTLVDYTVLGNMAPPDSLLYLDSIVNASTISLYSSPVDDVSVRLYEFRLGSSWTGGVFLGAFASPNLNLYGVKPGTHTFWANTLSYNGQYGDVPVSETVALLLEPPDGWSYCGAHPSDSCDYNGVGVHSNTEYYLYIANDTLKCSHTAGVLTGVYTSPVYDRGVSARVLAYLINELYVMGGAGANWDDQVPLVLTGGEILLNNDFSLWDSFGVIDTWVESGCTATEISGGSVGTGVNVVAGVAAGLIAQGVVVVPGAWYLLTFYYKNAVGDQATLGVWDATNSVWITPQNLMPNCLQMSLANELAWKEYGYLFQAPVGCVDVTICLGASHAGDSVYFDESSLQRVDVAAATSVTWNELDASRTWDSIFGGTASINVAIKLKYGDTNPPTNEVSRMEILSAIVEGQYFQVEITLTDPSPTTFGLVGEFTLFYCDSF